ncbi:helix-turn-helix domain-containing protein [Lysinibacillus sp. NPDC048646]|uniref:helix-turn-helix domain-containing protein n=1 Tax=Lysinibacillus sp. NPDC048646 TaxID=3390574 RepID=UPI003CFD01DB
MVELKFKLKEVLQARGMSQLELAQKTGVTTTVISELATNRRTSINREYATKVIKALEITDMNEIFEVK